MRIYICSFWAGETRFLARNILVWDQLVHCTGNSAGIFRLSVDRHRKPSAARRSGPMSSERDDHLRSLSDYTLSSVPQGSYPDFPRQTGFGSESWTLGGVSRFVREVARA